MQANGIVVFHDSSLIYRALKLIRIYLRRQGRHHAFLKRRNSQMSAIFLGHADLGDAERYLGPAEDPAEFFGRRGRSAEDPGAPTGSVRVRSKNPYRPQGHRPEGAQGLLKARVCPWSAGILPALPRGGTERAGRDASAPRTRAFLSRSRERIGTTM